MLLVAALLLGVGLFGVVVVGVGGILASGVLFAEPSQQASQDLPPQEPHSDAQQVEPVDGSEQAGTPQASPASDASSGATSPREGGPSTSTPASTESGDGLASLSDSSEKSAPSPDAAPSVEGCGEASALEAAAAAGRLSSSASACLGELMRSSDQRQTERERAGRVLLVNADAACRGAGDCAAYEAVQTYFFSEITQSDPTMVLKWAEHLARRGMASTEQAAEIIRWTDRAYERRMQWKGKDFVTYSDRLYELRAKASAQAYTESSEERWRLLARDNAVEWANFRL